MASPLHRSDRALSRSWIMVALFAFSSMGASACFLDFDEFETSDAPILDGGHDPAPDADEDAQVAPDAGDDDTADTESPDADTVISAEIGGSCAEDNDCEGDGICRENYCTADCSGGALCETGSSCQQITRGPHAGEALCVLDCNHGDDAACSQSGRDDLRCLPVNQLPSASFGPGAQSGCLPDQDDDGVADLFDNCVDTANPDQLDFDADGIGNACDSEPSCHALAVDGVLDYGAIEYPASNFSIPHSSHHDWIPVFGGTDEDGEQVSTVRILDRVTGTWQTAPDLPFAAFDRRATPSADGEYVLTPGRVNLDGQPYEQPLYLSRSGDARLAPKSVFPTHITAAATTGRGQVFVHGITSHRSLSPYSWKVFAVDLAQRTIQNTSSGSTLRRTWRSTQSLSGGVIFYSDAVAAGSSMQINFSTPLGNDFKQKSLTLSASDDTDIKPFIIPAGGHYLHIMDRNTGRMWRYSTETSSLEETPALDVDLSGLEDPVFISTPQATSFIALERPSDASDTLHAREYFLGCMPAYTESTDADTDGDGIHDFLDNCPLYSNYDQSDFDGDRRGDSCDPDIDGDGYSNTAENDAGTDPQDPLSFPDAGYLTYIRDDGSTRSLEYAALAGLDSPTVLTDEDAPSDAQPHQPRFIYNKSLIMTLAGAPESATAVDIFKLHGDDPSTPTTLETGVTLRSAAVLDASYTESMPPVITAIHPDTDSPGSWALSNIPHAETDAAALITTLPELRDLDSNGKGAATFLGGPGDCDACLSTYLLSGEPAQISPLARLDGDRPRLHTRVDVNKAVASILPSPDGWGHSGYFDGQLFRPPGSTQINSFLSTGQGHNLIVSARRDDASTYALWLYNSRADKWYRILSAPEDLIEVDWVAKLPEAPVVQEPQEPQQPAL